MTKLISQNRVTKLISRPTVTRLISVARQGVPGPVGPGIGVKQGSFSDPAPVVGEHVLIVYALYPMTINGLFGLKTASGDITCAVQINGVDVAGLTGLVANSTPQNPAATGDNLVEVGDQVALMLSDNNSAEGLKLMLKGTTLT